jgi:hypothetical protein
MQPSYRDRDSGHEYRQICQGTDRRYACSRKRHPIDQRRHDRHKHGKEYPIPIGRALRACRKIEVVLESGRDCFGEIHRGPLSESRAMLALSHPAEMRNNLVSPIITSPARRIEIGVPRARRGRFPQWPPASSAHCRWAAPCRPTSAGSLRIRRKCRVR